VVRDEEADERRRKVVQYIGFADDVAGERGDHGTHVAGTVAGKSTVTPAGTVYDGMAPEAKIAFFDIGVAGQPFLDVPRSLRRELFPPAKESGAAIHTNSWGSTANRYTLNARDIDQYSYENEEFVVLVAAGNDGSRGRGSLGSPATAKNCISVGASVNAATGSIEDMASFSSRGPTSDGRIKPDIAAPGHAVDSANSSPNPSAATCSITRQSGTSMATPAAAGTVALVRQYFREGFYPSGTRTSADGFVPSGALLKAVMVHSGQQMTGQVYGDTYPGNVQGFGRITMDRVLQLGAPAAGTRRLFVHGSKVGQTRVQLQQGESFAKSFTTTAAGEFKATLVWMDAPAATNARRHLVNDLDLLVTVGGQSHFPNGGSSADSVNNVEMTRIANAAPGTYAVSVRARAVRVGGSQPYALAVTGNFGEPGQGGGAAPAPPDMPPVSGSSYRKLTAGTGPQSCNGASLAPIREAATCEAAARELGLADTTVTRIRSSNRPDGCYFLGGRLYLAVSAANRGNGVVGQREPICQAGASELYRKLSAGACSDGGLLPIRDPATCEAAAAELGLGDRTVSTTGAAPRPEGCYYRGVLPGSALFLAVSPSNVGSGAAEGREPICLVPAGFRSANNNASTTPGPSASVPASTSAGPSASGPASSTAGPSASGPASTTARGQSAVVSAARRAAAATSLLLFAATALLVSAGRN